MRAVLLALALLGSTAPAAALSQPAAPAAAAADPAAFALAQLVAPPDVFIDMEVAMAQRGLEKLPELDPEAGELEKEYPGIHKAMWEAAAPAVRDYSKSDLQKFWVRLATFYSSRLTAAEIAGLTAFYDSPTGRRMIRDMGASMDPVPVLDEILSSKDQKVSEGSMRRMQAAAVSEAVGGLTSDDEPALLALTRTISFQKLTSVGREVQKITVDWVNAEDPEFDAVLMPLMEAAMTDFIEKADAKR